MHKKKITSLKDVCIPRKLFLVPKQTAGSQLVKVG